MGHSLCYRKQKRKGRSENVPFAFKKMSHSERIRIYIISFVSCRCVYNRIIQRGIHLSYGVRHTHTQMYISKKLSIKTSTARTSVLALVASLLRFSTAIQIDRQWQRKQSLCLFLYLWALPFSLSLTFIPRYFLELDSNEWARERHSGFC